MHIERLKTLRDVIAATPDEAVNMGTWRGDPGGWAKDPAKPECGTIACMLGWACMVPEFQAAGLKFLAFANVPEGFRHLDFIPSYEDDISYSAGEAFFELDPGVGYALFKTAEAGLNQKAVALGRLDYLLKEGHLGGYFDPQPPADPDDDQTW